MSSLRAEIIAIASPGILPESDRIEGCLLSRSQVLELEGLIARTVEQFSRSPRDLGIIPRPLLSPVLGKYGEEQKETA